MSTTIPGLSGIANAQNDLTDIPVPDPVAEKAAMNVHDGAAVNLFAADPDIAKPIQMNFDSTGGLWIASSEIYPQIRPGEVANDKIIVLRDTDGDGVCDSRKVFADGLLIPTGVLPDGPHAAYIVDSTRLLYMQDTDHDGRADKSTVVLSGFGTEDTHHLVHTLRFGPDGCLYFNQSIYIHSHIDTPDGSRHLDGGGIWRFRPSTNELEVFCKGFINPWGHSFDSAGESFVTDGAFFEGINYTFPDAVFATSPGATRWLSGLNPGSPKHCGLEILSGDHIPPDWSGSLVTSDFRSHRVCRFTLKPSASGYLSRQQPEIITTPHVAFRPIDARMGPDGALYVADWYNPIIQHGEVDFRDDRRDRTHGRIWRVSFPDRPLDHWPDFAAASLEELRDMLSDSSLATAQFARQEIWKRAQQDPDNVLAAVRTWTDLDDSSNERSWLYEAIPGATFEDIWGQLQGVDAKQPKFQRTALRSAWRTRLRWPAGSQQRQQIESFVLAQAASPIAANRLEAVVSAGQLDSETAFAAVLSATQHDIDDPLDFAIWQSLRAIDTRFADQQSGQSILASMDWTNRPAQLAFAVSAIATPASAETALSMIESGNVDQAAIEALLPAVAAAGNAQQLGRAARTLLVDRDVRTIAPLMPLIDRTNTDKTAPAGIGEVLATIVSGPGDLTDAPAWATAVATMVKTWKIGELESTIESAIPTAADSQLRSQLIEALSALDSPSSIQAVNELAGSDDPATRLAAIRSIAQRRPGAAIGHVVRMLATGPAAEQEMTADLIAQMISRKGVSDALAAAINKVSLDPDVARKLSRRVQSAGGSEALMAAITASGKLEQATWKLTPELVSRITDKVRSHGSAAKGEQIYRQSSLQCVACHAIGTAGGLVGPNLISIGGSAQIDYIIESLIDPSAKLKEGYTTLSLLSDEGQLINGIVIGRDEDAVRMRLADGKEVQIDADSIELEKPGKSLMPAGLVDPLSESDLVDLVAFLSALGRSAEFTVSAEPMVRSFETLVYTPEANRRLNRTSTDTVAGGDPAMQWRSVTTTVNGTLPMSDLDQFQQHRQTPPTSFIRFPVNLQADGNVQIDFPRIGETSTQQAAASDADSPKEGEFPNETGPPEGIEAWVDGRPTPTWNLKSLALAAGDHVIVLSIDLSKHPGPLAIRMNGDAAP
ncbi:hypothetical protein K227x_45140 [Rubripirellula lacrimiformis]|uniref:Cytochrome c domain-containing protein n=1 Tax=Rubripirellula lacrimiformis TaxID=1930273 RepID=A0A517NG45_9BACT|nr:PVC-type heme-binding CxxCH protein [Rubripirellula lacrimiformis]QDT06107.1 hypothetical protein K227x_45140 [Rubripirellula lacrimiformis]